MHDPIDIALHRFGLGARPRERQGLSDPRGWLLAQLDAPPLTPALDALPSSAARTQETLALFRRRDPDEGRRERVGAMHREEAAARLRTRATSDAPFYERWVAFWSNHLCVSTSNPALRGLAGAYERTAIRPHVTGRFADLLRAATQHPGMLVYLDQAQSIGPNSPVGRATGRGLNENLARELLELHTLGVDGGYGQPDVEALARLLTGWSAVDERLQAPGGFVYVAERHEPGLHELLGVRYGGAGQRDGEAALDALARHPATARHLATKLARHFVDDEPPADAVDRLHAAWRDSDGDLREVAKAVVNEPRAWERPLSKLRSPDDLVTAVARAVAHAVDPGVALSGVVELGQPPWGPPSPAGWPDVAAEWAGPAQILGRVTWAEQVAARLADRAASVARVRAFAEEVLGSLLTPSTAAHLDAASDVGEALTLLLASPELQRR